jgi:hypothetical protein
MTIHAVHNMIRHRYFSCLQRTLWTAALILLACLFSATVCVQGQTSPPALAPADIATRVAGIHPKTVVFVFDVTMSTEHNGVFQNERAATATILRDGCDPGDRVILLQFGTGVATVFDKTLETREDAVALVDQIPPAPVPGRGTNIRLPHHQALKLVDAGLPQPGVIVLLTDSFNDQPAPADPNMPQYTAYYSPKGLTIYPHTPENADYERLLRTLKASGKLYQFGVGVGIAPSGRPIERIPTAAESDAPDTAGPTLDLSQEQTNNEQVRRIGDYPFLVIGCFTVIVLGLIWAGAALMRPTPVRLTLADKGMPRDFRLKSGAKVCLGGTLANCGPGDDFLPLAGLAAPAAFVAASGGGAVLNPGGDRSATSPKVFHNGIPLEYPTPLRIGDEIRISAPSTNAPVPTEFRIRFSDPKEPHF